MICALALIKEIHRNYFLCDLLSNSHDSLMLGMIVVEIEGGAIRIFRDKAGIERALKMQDIGTDLKTLDVRNHAL